MPATEVIRPKLAIQRDARRLVHFDESFPVELLAMLWQTPESLLASGEPLRAVGVRQTVKLTHGSQQYVMKHYGEPSWRHTVKQLVLPSRAWQTWRKGQRLADAGIATPRPVACLEYRWGPFRRDSYLIYPFVPGRQLKSFFSRRVATPQDLRDRLWQQLEELWLRLAALRASLGDANLGNFIVTPNEQLWVIDLDKARFHRFAFRAARQQHLRWQQVLKSATKHGWRRSKAAAA